MKSWFSLLLAVLCLHATSARCGADWPAMRREVKELENQSAWIGKAEAFRRLQDMAERGNLVAGVSACQLFFDEDNPARDVEAGAALARDLVGRLDTLADQGDPDAQYYLAGFHARGWGAVQDDDRSMELLRRAAEGGSAWAQAELGRRYINGIVVEEDPVEADRFLNQALESRDPDVCFNVAFCYADLYFSVRVRDQEKALNAYTVAAENGHACAASCLADLYKAGEKVPQDLEKAAYWQRRAAELGWASASWELGEEAFERQDYETAVSWYRKSAEDGFALACEKLAEMYGSGTEIAADSAQADLWRDKARLLRSVEAGETPAQDLPPVEPENREPVGGDSDLPVMPD